MLLNLATPGINLAGCDEAGRGCLAGPVVAAAVILSEDFFHPKLNDSKQLHKAVREELSIFIQEHALAYGIGMASAEEIDQINILQASFLAMHRALSAIQIPIHKILVDGNRFKPYGNIPYECIIKGDAKIMHIAAASILAKTTRDDIMEALHHQYPYYGWDSNMGYPTKIHREALITHGISPYHRRTYKTVSCL